MSDESVKEADEYIKLLMSKGYRNLRLSRFIVKGPTGIHRIEHTVVIFELPHSLNHKYELCITIFEKDIVILENILSVLDGFNLVSYTEEHLHGNIVKKIIHGAHVIVTGARHEYINDDTIKYRIYCDVLKKIAYMESMIVDDNVVKKWTSSPTYTKVGDILL